MISGPNLVEIGSESGLSDSRGRGSEGVGAAEGVFGWEGSVAPLESLAYRTKIPAQRISTEGPANN